ncbi:unnamed protein product [Calicophoron daubneyi]|uniref:Sperm-associated antigen 17 n=1 Tax=Calicophoron daubneyi TaxID=300641 RepID=A0AAV2T8H0_CALDB
MFAKVMKFILVDIRTKDAALRESMKKLRESPPNKPKGKSSDAKSKGKAQGSAKGMDKRGQPQQQQSEPPSVKGESKLHKRGEEISAEKFIGDEPDNEISRYVIFTGFTNPGMIEQLCNLGIHVHSIIRLRIEDIERLQELLLKQKAEKMWGAKEGQSIDDMRAEQEWIDNEGRKLQIYWNKINVLLRDHSYGLLGNIATLDYRVKRGLLPEDFSGTENRLRFGAKMFDEIAYMLYDLIDFRRQWENYLRNIKVLHLPVYYPRSLENTEAKEDTKMATTERSAHTVLGSQDPMPPPNPSPVKELERLQNSNPDKVDNRIYQETLQGLPVESTSVELVLHAILEQVAASEGGVLPRSAQNTRKAESDGISYSIMETLGKSVGDLILTDEERKAISSELPLATRQHSQNTDSPSLFIHPHNETELRCRFGSGAVIDPEGLQSAELRLLRICYPELKLIHSEKWRKLDFPNTKSGSCEDMLRSQTHRDGRYQQLLHFAEKFGLTSEEFEHGLLTMLLESIPMHQLEGAREAKDSGTRGTLVEILNQYLVESVTMLNPFDDPYLPYERLVAALLSDELRPVRTNSTTSTSATVTGSTTKISELTESDSREGDEVCMDLDRSINSSDRSSGERASRPRSVKSASSGRTQSAKSGGILKNTRSPSSTGSGRISRAQSAVHFDLTGSESVADKDQTDSANQSGSSQISAKQLMDILERIQAKYSKRSPPSDTNGNEGKCSNRGKAIIDREMFDSLLKTFCTQLLDEWCIEERMEIDVLLQKIHASSYQKPNMKVSERRQDGGLMILIYHQFDRTLRSDHKAWSNWFHVAKIGFRSYLQHVESQITSWTKEQEAAYQAIRLSAEISQSLKEEQTKEEVEQESRRGKGEARRKSKPKAVEASKQSLSNSVESLTGGLENYIAPGSLKAQKMEHERAQEAKGASGQEQENKKSPSRNRGQKKSQAVIESAGSKKPETKSGGSGSRNSRKRGRSPRDTESPSKDLSNQSSETLIFSQEEFWPFLGYDLDNVVPHWTGEVTHMFPTDGGTIRTQRTELPNGESALRVSLLKDEHVLTVHRIDGPPDPCDSNREAQEIDNEFKTSNRRTDLKNSSNNAPDSVQMAVNPGGAVHSSKQNADKSENYFSSFTANFADGLNLTIVSSAHNDRSPRELFGSSKGEGSQQTKLAIPVYVTEDGTPVCDETERQYSLNKSGQHLYVSLPDGAQIESFRVDYREMSRVPVNCAALGEILEGPDTCSRRTDEEAVLAATALVGEDVLPQPTFKDDFRKEEISLLKLRPAVLHNRETGISEENVPEKETEFCRYFASTGFILIVTKFKKGCEQATGFRVLYPNGDIAECGTLSAEQRRAVECPQFPSDIKPEPSTPTDIMEPRRSTIRLSPSPGTRGQSKTKSARRKAGDKKKSIAEMPSDSSESGTKGLSSATNRSQNDRKDVAEAIPWLITLASGKCFWLKTVKLPEKVLSNSTNSVSISVGDIKTEEMTEKSTLKSDEKSSQESSYETVPSKSMDVFKSYDPSTGQTLKTRPEDGLIVVYPGKKTRLGITVQYPDGTRLTQIYCPEEQFQTAAGENKENERGNNCCSKSNANDDADMFLRFECPGFPATLLNTSTGDFEVCLFGNALEASKLYSSSQGHHTLQHSHGGQLNVEPSGSILYVTTAHPFLEKAEHSDELLNYVMHCDGSPVLLETIDPQGNAFTVDCLANCNVLLTIKEEHNNIFNEAKEQLSAVQPGESVETLIEPQYVEPLNELTTEGESLADFQRPINHEEHIPQLYYLKPKFNMAVEFLRFRDACRLFAQARQIETTHSGWTMCDFGSGSGDLLSNVPTKSYQISSKDISELSDREAVFIQETFQSNPEIFGLTLMQPIYSHKPRSAYVQNSIIPKGLTSRDFSSHTEKMTVSPPPKLGQKAGHGLDIINPKLDYVIPKASDLIFPLLPVFRARETNYGGKNFQPHIKLRRFTQYQPLTEQNRSRIVDVLHAYSEHMLNRAVEWCLCQPIRLPHARRRYPLGLAASLSEPAPTEHEPLEALPSKEIMEETNPVQSVGSATQNLPDTSDTSVKFRLETSVEMSQARKAAFLALSQELERAMQNRAALRNSRVPNYFRSKEGMNFLLSQGPDPTRIIEKVSTLPAVDAKNLQQPVKGKRGILTEQLKDASSNTPAATSIPVLSNETKPDFINNQRDFKDDKIHSGFAEFHMPQNSSSKFVYYRPVSEDEVWKMQNVPLDAIALAKHKRMKVPKYLFASRPHRFVYHGHMVGGVLRNLKHALVEDPVRRKALFSSVIGGPETGQLALRLTRGLRLQPCRLDCSTVKPGCTKYFRVRLVNWGPETAYFRVSSPPESTGIQLAYKPGPIPAGLSRDLHIKVSVPPPDLGATNSMVIESKRLKIVHQVKLVTDTHIMNLPITLEANA